MPYQLYVLTHRALHVRLLGAAELGPLIAMALCAGVLADYLERRMLMFWAQIGVLACTGGLAASAIAAEYGLSTLADVLGPALDGLLTTALGVQGAYAANVITAAAVLATVIPLAPQRGSHAGKSRTPALRSIAEGTRFVLGNRALLGSFAADLLAMTLGMPRASGWRVRCSQSPELPTPSAPFAERRSTNTSRRSVTEVGSRRYSGSS